MPRRPPPALLCTLALAAALALAACGEREEPPITTTTEQRFEITGNWQGRLAQRGVKPFAVAATIASLERSKQNTVRYTGAIECSGTWDYLGASATAYRFRETIERGAGKRCKGTGTVELTPLTQDSVDYVFRGGGVTSRGVLRRGAGKGGGGQGDGAGGASGAGGN